jgi:hypothetical protein
LLMKSGGELDLEARSARQVQIQRRTIRVFLHKSDPKESRNLYKTSDRYKITENSLKGKGI